MLNLRLACPVDLTDTVLELLGSEPAVSELSVIRGASLKPEGDLVVASVAREAANAVIDELRELELHTRGSIQVEHVRTWMSRRGLQSQRIAPGSGADSVVWAEVTQQAFEDSETNWTFMTLITLATLLSAIAIIVHSEILIIGAMVIGPEFGAVAALGLALVRRRPTLLRLASRTLAAGFALALTATLIASIAGRALGWFTEQDVTREDPAFSFIYTPDRWSFLVAIIAGSAGVLAMTSARIGGLSGVFISVTTIPAVAHIALGICFWNGDAIWGSTQQLALNLVGMMIAGWATLAVQQAIWSRVSAQRARLVRRAAREPVDSLTR